MSAPSKKIVALTSIRSDYDLMSALYRRLHADPEIELTLLVYGAHLSKKHGYSIDLIKKDGFNILASLTTLLDADTGAGQLKTAAMMLTSAIDIIQNYQPDCILYVGDREDVIMGGLLGTYLNIPTIHFWGGDHALDGHVDHMVRHATSKLSSIHMVSLPQHQQRLVKMGEDPKRIFHIGSMALDHLVQHKPDSKAAIRQHFHIQAGFEDFALMIFHPFREELSHYLEYFELILETLKHNDQCVFISAPNTDPGNQGVFSLIEKYAQEPHFHYVANLPRKIFHSIYKQASFIIGNSSSGILEAASIPIPAINVGQREVGRLCANNVIFCRAERDAIDAAIKKAMSMEFKQSIRLCRNPYGDGQSSAHAYDLIKMLSLNDYVVKMEDPLEISEL